MPGPPKKPTNVRIAEGSRAHRPLNKNEPQPALGEIRVPQGMPAIAQRKWREIVPELDRLNLLTIIDTGALEAACRGYAQGVLADRQVDKLQALMNSGKASRDSYYHLSITNAVSRKAWQQWKSFCTEFGLTPASRARLSTDVTPSPGTRPHTGKKMDDIEAVLCASLPN